jgi:hypothetical protein
MFSCSLFSCVCVCVCVCVCDAKNWIEIRATHMLGKSTTIKLHPQPFLILFWDRVLLNCLGWPWTCDLASAFQVAGIIGMNHHIWPCSSISHHYTLPMPPDPAIHPQRPLHPWCICSSQTCSGASSYLRAFSQAVLLAELPSISAPNHTASESVPSPSQKPRQC